MDYANSHASLNGNIHGADFSISGLMPPQAIPTAKKTKAWKKATMDALHRIGERQNQDSLKFRDYKKMVDGEFTYLGTGFGELEGNNSFFSKQVRRLRQDRGIPTHIKHFDFIGIVCNALSGIYNEFEDIFRIDSLDEYFTNEYIRQKTELLHKYAAETFNNEVNRLLLQRGIDVNKSDFQSEEEAQQYQQEIDQQVKALTPEEIEVFMQKNFKVLATEWAQNTLDEDNKEFHLHELDREEFIDYLLSGRYFRHFRVGYDSYSIERWKPEETFFSQDVDAKYPQDGEFVGRITNLSPSAIINTFGHLLSSKEQEAISNYWNQNDYWQNGKTNSLSVMERAFPEAHIVPFTNYYEHDLATQMEDALGEPLGIRTFLDKDGEERQIEDWLPRLGGQQTTDSNIFSKYLRDDIEVRSDTIQVTEAYWRSYKRVGVLTYENSVGVLSQEITTDDLLADFLAENEIKKIRNISLEEFQIALKNNKMDEYVNTIVYAYTPEIWKGIKIRGNGNTLKEDLYLDVRPLDYQIKGSRSNIYDVKLPVAGIISVGIAKKLEPYQVLHNICMNQITELLEKELGIFFTFDLMYLPAEYKDGTTEDAIYDMRDMIKSTGLFAVDMSKQNTEGNQALTNSFQRQDITYASQVQYRWQMAMQYKEQALSQIGITPQLLGQPNTYTTSEGVKQGQNASYALITPLFEKMNTAKAKEKDIHIAIAQYCQSNGKDASVMFRKDDGAHYLLDIMAEDGELFPLRHMGVVSVLSARDRKSIEQIRNLMLNDNTIQRDLQSSIEILTNPTLIEIKQAAADNRKRFQQEQQEARQFQDDQLNKQIESTNQQLLEERQFERENLILTNTSKERQTYIAHLGSAVDSNATPDELAIYKTEVTNLLAQNKQISDVDLRQQEIDRKSKSDIESNKVKMQELGLRSRELALKQQALETQKFTSIINKN